MSVTINQLIKPESVWGCFEPVQSAAV